jgi:23S rRNA (cytidine1920-2'-O)/16S rRNA (cytidine1409-2'-O)-methyltransferase
MQEHCVNWSQNAILLQKAARLSGLLFSGAVGTILPVPVKMRLDQLLVLRGLSSSREKAQRSIMAGQVLLAGQKAEKPGTRVADDAVVEILAGEKYVGRGGLKLEAALDHFQIPVAGRAGLDIGASTGGFTDCLLQRGAASVHSTDVGHGQIDWRLRNDPRVTVREGVNARFLTTADTGGLVDICVADVSFISLTLILPAAFALLSPTADMVVLIKPQFELTPDKVAKGGVVRDPAFHEEAVEKIRAFVGAAGRRWQGVIESPITGREGNIEFLAHLRP